MPSDIREFYRVLELSPGASLDEIKRSYRRLLQQWHPDRYKPGSVMQTTAEDVTKELNEAYHQLCRKKRYLEFRPKPPPAAPATDAAHAPEPRPPFQQAQKAYAASAPPPPRDPAPPPPAPPESARPASPPPSSRPRAAARKKFLRWPRRAGRFFALGSAVAGVFFAVSVWHKVLGTWPVANSAPLARVSSTGWSEAPRSAPASSAAASKVATQTPARSTTARAAPEKRPALDPPRTSEPSAAKPPEVFTKPAFPFAFATEPAADTFGPAGGSLAAASSESRVRADVPAAFRFPATGARALTTLRAFDPPASLLDTFAPGDTKARVIEVQGTPDEATENMFRYGSSLVYFAADRVTLWSDGWPRLRVLLLPNFDFSGVAAFDVGSTRSEVVRVQGMPTQTTANAFYYGASAVYFDRAWVIGWSEVDRPLHARAGVTAPRGGRAATPAF
ncbi:MAG TPA: J domain-containing protein [Opitutaceae bacterium]|nr:J domain-containing protein [Opitutaceae bacterium]